MPILHHVRQGSDAWDKLRLGIPTSSVFDRVWTPPSVKYPRGQQSKQWEDLGFTLLAERFLGYKMATYVSPHMEDGKEYEEEAADWYELTTHRVPVLIGFITNDAGTIGCSPDRLVGDDGLLEVKVPKANTQMKYLIKGTIAVDYWPQLQGQLWISDRQWVDIVAYSQILPRCVIRVERDEPYIAKLAVELDKLVEYIEVCWEKIQEMAGRSNGAPKDPRQGDLGRLKAQLEASLAREDKARSAGTVAAQTEVVGDRPMPGVLPHREPGETSAPLTEPVPEPDAGGVARPERGGTAGEASANLASPKTCEQCSGPCDEAGYCRDPNCSAHWAYTSGSRESQTPGAEPGANSRRDSGDELQLSADATPQPGIGGGGSSGRKGESPTQTWRCSCGEEFEIYGAFSRHKQRTGHTAPTEQRPEALRAGRSSSGQDAGIAAGPQVGVNPETRVRVPPDSTSTEETFWDIAARSGDYKVEIPDNIATIGRDTMMNLVAGAPTVEALTAFYQGNLATIERMGRARVASRNELVKAMTRRKKELSGE